MLKKIINRTSLKAVFVFSMVSTVISGYTVEPVSFKQVHVDGGFWLPRLEMNYKVTIPYDVNRLWQAGSGRADPVPLSFEGVTCDKDMSLCHRLLNVLICEFALGSVIFSRI